MIVQSSITWFVNKFYNIINIVLDKKHNSYLYYIRYMIYRAKNPTDLLSIFQTIASNNKFITTDELLELLTECFIKYPLTEIELQKMSYWQQLYNVDLGIYCYVTTTFWLCIILAIQENESTKLLK